LRLGAPQPGGGRRAGRRPGRRRVPLSPALPGRPGRDPQWAGFRARPPGGADEAIAEFRKAITADPKFTPAYNNLAEALARQGKLEDAADYYQRSLAQRPNPAVHNALGGILRQLGRADEAEVQFSKAKALQFVR
jgi:pentatricopeptide repeat protein